MKTIFGEFDEFDQAQSAVTDLVGQVDLDDINVIVLKETARGALTGLDWNRVKAEKSGEFGRDHLQGLEQILAGRQAVHVSGIGPVFAAGPLANIMAKSGADPAAVDGGFKAALVDFDVPAEAAQEYADGVKAGGVLVFVRASEEKAPLVANTMRAFKGRNVSAYADGRGA